MGMQEMGQPWQHILYFLYIRVVPITILIGIPQTLPKMQCKQICKSMHQADHITSSIPTQADNIGGGAILRLGQVFIPWVNKTWCWRGPAQVDPFRAPLFSPTSLPSSSTLKRVRSLQNVLFLSHYYLLICQIMFEINSKTIKCTLMLSVVHQYVFNLAVTFNMQGCQAWCTLNANWCYVFHTY